VDPDVPGAGMLGDMADPEPIPLLLVEDDRELSQLLVRLFSGEGYLVHAVRDLQAGLHAAMSRTVAVMVVDRRLPDGDGVDLIRRVRTSGVVTPALVLTAHGSVEDRVEGLDGGADDYLVKPFDSSELLARVRSLLRRHLESATVVPLGDGAVDIDAHEVRLSDGSRVELSPAETAFLAQLARRPARVFSRDELRDSLAPGTRSLSLVDTYVYSIRRKLGHAAIRTVRGVGYRAGELG
jgi:two-component system response regulator QseB